MGRLEALSGQRRAAHELEAAIAELLARPEHAWFEGKLSPEEREARRQAQEEFKKRHAD